MKWILETILYLWIVLLFCSYCFSLPALLSFICRFCYQLVVSICYSLTLFTSLVYILDVLIFLISYWFFYWQQIPVTKWSRQNPILAASTAGATTSVPGRTPLYPTAAKRASPSKPPAVGVWLMTRVPSPAPWSPPPTSVPVWPPPRRQNTVRINGKSIQFAAALRRKHWIGLHSYRFETHDYQQWFNFVPFYFVPRFLEKTYCLLFFWFVFFLGGGGYSPVLYLYVERI